MAYKVLLLDGIDTVCKTILEKRGIQADTAPKLAGEELLAAIADYDGIVVRSATNVDETLLKAAPRLKVVGRAGVGVDNIDITMATKMGVLVMNTPDGNTISTAEHTCGLLLSLARNIPNAVNSLKNDAWDRKKYTGSELSGKVLGVVGLGKIGSGVAERMTAFGMDVIAYDPFTTREKAQELGVRLADLDEVLSKADFLTVHTPLTEKTRGLVSRANAGKLKKGVRLVNCARGGIFDENDLVELLNDGTVGGVALDVYSIEPPDAGFAALLKHPNVVCTPHLGASTEEAQEKVAEQIAEQIADTLELKSFKGTLNGKAIALSTNKEVQPYLKLAQKLGDFVAQVVPDNTDSLEIEYVGNCAQHGEVLTDAILMGYLANYSDESVNLINARYLADFRGLRFRETLSRDSRTYSDLIRVRIAGKSRFKDFAATTFGENDYRIVEIDGFGIELSLKGIIVLYKNIDKPGMLAAVSTEMSKRDINIAALSLGRSAKGHEAITAFRVDRKLSGEELKAIDDVDGVDFAHYIEMAEAK
jgi:D-3-phosphoglycerate dehydrogenase / 2-oxoglutarate reductase